MTEISPRIYFDTNIFCDAFEGHSDSATQLKTVFEVARKQPGRIVTSEYTLAELLGKETPEVSLKHQTDFYMNLIVFSEFIDLQAVSRDILIGTGEFRRQADKEGRRVKLGDAIHAVTAIKAGCRVLFTSDRRFSAPYPIRILRPDTLGIGLVKAALDA